MARREEIEMHAGRALAELACARSAVCDAAAFAHLELSELHLARLRVLKEAPMPALRLVRAAGSDAITQANQMFRRS